MTRRSREAEANEALTRALLTIASQGQRTHCSDPETHHYWTSEREAERRRPADPTPTRPEALT
jgi:hypothetical protein